MKTNEEIDKALQLAREYAAFAPGRLMRKQMEVDGDELYEALLPSLAVAALLFPDLDFVKRMRCVSLLILAKKAKLGPLTEQEMQEHRVNRSEFDSSVKPFLTPFQVALMERECPLLPE